MHLLFKLKCYSIEIVYSFYLSFIINKARLNMIPFSIRIELINSNMDRQNCWQTLMFLNKIDIINYFFENTHGSCFWKGLVESQASAISFIKGENLESRDTNISVIRYGYRNRQMIARGGWGNSHTRKGGRILFLACILLRVFVCARSLSLVSSWSDYQNKKVCRLCDSNNVYLL